MLLPSSLLTCSPPPAAHAPPRCLPEPPSLPLPLPGTSLYNEILKSFLPHAYPAPEAEGSSEDGSGSGSSSGSDLEAPLILPSRSSGMMGPGAISPRVAGGFGSVFSASGASGGSSLQEPLLPTSPSKQAACKPVKIRGSSATHAQQQASKLPQSYCSPCLAIIDSPLLLSPPCSHPVPAAALHDGSLHDSRHHYSVAPPS